MNIKKCMVKKHVKFIAKSKYKNKLLKFLEDLESWNIQWYDIKILQWYEWYFRVRIGDVRIIFTYQNKLPFVVKIDNRGDIY